MCTVQFVRTFQSASSGLKSLLCGFGFGLQQSWKELSRVAVLTGSSLPFGEKKGSKRYMIELASSVLAKKAFERYQRRLNSFKSNAFMINRLLDYKESQNKTLQSRFVGLPSLSPHFQ